MRSFGFGFGIASAPHVWHQQRKVTPFTGYRNRGQGGRYWAGRYPGPEDLRKREKAANMAIYRRRSRTVAKAARQSTTVSHAGKSFFRLIDGHGKSYGPRLQSLGHARSTGGYQMDRWFLVRDLQDREQWLHGEMRVRLVDRQPEDLFSQASRIINRMHRQLTKESE